MNSLIIRPIISEKSINEAAKGRFTFEVDKTTNKTEIGKAVAESFKVKVIKVQTITIPEKVKRSYRSRKTSTKSSWKKAVVTLTPGQKIDLFDVTEQPIKE